MENLLLKVIKNIVETDERSLKCGVTDFNSAVMEHQWLDTYYELELVLKLPQEEHLEKFIKIPLLYHFGLEKFPCLRITCFPYDYSQKLSSCKHFPLQFHLSKTRFMLKKHFYSSNA
ncbi:CLUMA_CG010992, isoform A [Clunio marinus]|uniref:CLUMA_CG010992, isoform A n=1 Tax=Clunio marinus TaxID=568069 RepID=A0A1J1IF30_9DIPT|nr:CLUMA_CG010992, isoform A [Clunio marinus]